MAQGERVVEPQDLYVGDKKAVALDRRKHFAQGGAVASGEDILVDEGIGRGWAVGPSDRVEQGHAVLGQELAHPGKEAPVMGDADVLEHADRDDAVELPVELAIVAKLEA